jgi:protein SMG6
VHRLPSAIFLQNIISSFAFGPTHVSLLESLRHASFNSCFALERLRNFIYYAYAFYTGLLEEQTLRTFRAGWLGALGGLARYFVAVATVVTSSQIPGPEELTVVSAVLSVSPSSLSSADHVSNVSAKSSLAFEKPVARIDDSPSPCIGLAAAMLLVVEPEKERWMGIARDWYAQGLADAPGNGKLHHHLGLLSREKEGGELKAVYHFVKR